MIFLQADTSIISNAANSEINNFWFTLEIVLIVGVIAYQLYHTAQVYKSITELKSIFDFPLKVFNGFIEKAKLNQSENTIDEILYESDFSNESYDQIIDDDIIKLSLIETNGKNEIIKRTKTTLNTYLINNYGAAVNFSVIKDIIDREVEVKDEEITQTISTPLYFGLAATMIGIIFGLMAMPNLTGAGFSDGVNALIRGVKWAMFASLSGLSCTTILSSFFYKDAKSKVLREKNEQLSYLQAKLLPELIKAEDTGVSGLKASLDRFARVATNISDDVLIAANQTGENLVLQQELMDKVEKIGVLRLSKTNLELYDKLDKNMDAFFKFSTYLERMESISSSLLDFASRTSNIDKVIEDIDATLKDSKQLFQFLSAHFDKIEMAGNAALKSVGLAESHFENAIENLKERTEKMINILYANAGENESKLEKIYEEIQSNLNKITSDYIKEFSDAYSNSMPKFQQLENLTILPTFKEEFSNRTIEIQNSSESNNLKLIDGINKLNESTTQLKQSINSDAIISKLEDIEGKLKSKTNKTYKKVEETKGTSINNSTSKNRTTEIKPITLGDLVKKIFKNG